EIFKERTVDNGVKYLYITELEDRFPVRAFFTTKDGGVSTGAFTSLNLGYNTDDDPELVTKNRQLLFDSMGVEDLIVAYPHQVHNDVIAHIDSDLQDIPEDRILRFPETDATVTDRKGVLLTSLHADCIPVWLYDPAKHVAGVAHAGWRGTRLDIAAKTAKEMCDRYGSQISDIIAVVGPGISHCCFEVGAEVYESFTEMIGELGSLVTNDHNGKYHLDLKGINRVLLERAGVGEVLVTEYCTSCRDDLFYSYRRDKGKTGRLCAGMMLL
ncbi:MAG: peptidoglycan editing factor PgeF, partial [Firmicutes bacterium]|nr:peptidoglycan editing factor PgeF [Bacillota bacterium]